MVWEGFTSRDVKKYSELEVGSYYRDTKGRFFLYDVQNNQRTFYYLDGEIIDEPLSQKQSSVRFAFPADFEEVKDELEIRNMESCLAKKSTQNPINLNPCLVS